MEKREVAQMSILSRRARVKELSNKAEGIFQYVGTDNVLFRLISTGNELTSDVNHAIALFTNFARSNQLPDTVTRSTIDSIYRRVGKLLCLVDIIHAAAGNLDCRAGRQPGHGFVEACMQHGESLCTAS